MVELTIKLNIEIGCLVVNRMKPYTTQGHVSYANQEEDTVKIDLKDGFKWEGTAEQFFNQWEVTDVPF